MAKGNMTDDILKVLIEEDAIAEKVKELGAKISADYAGKKLLVLGVLKGSFVFMADLIRAITVPCEIEFMAVSSYRSGVKSSGVVKIIKDIDINPQNVNILIVEDILDRRAYAELSQRAVFAARRDQHQNCDPA